MRKKRVAPARKKLLPVVRRRAERLYIGFDLGGTKLASGVVTESGVVLEARRDTLSFAMPASEFVASLAEVAAGWQRRFVGQKILGLGIASCGPLDTRAGVLLQPTNFPKWGDLRIAAPLRERLGLPVYMHNDAAAAAAVEGWLGGARNLKNWMVLTFGTGLGTGIVIKRKVFMGGSGLGPEAGHMILSDKPYACGCGNLGCAEAVLSGTALRRRIEERRDEWKNTASPAPESPEQLVSRARSGDKVARAIFSEFATVLARAIHNYAVMFSPQTIFLSGGLHSEADLFLPETSAKVAELLKNRAEILPQIKNSALGRHGGVLAGAWVAHHRLSKKNEI